jgi:hypothetical protein
MRQSIPRAHLVTVMGSDSILLWVPTDTVGMNSNFPACSRHQATLTIGDATSGPRIDANPYCSEVYSADEVSVALYHIQGAAWPLVEIITNHPAHIPFYLYAYDPTQQEYVLVREGQGG